MDIWSMRGEGRRGNRGIWGSADNIDGLDRCDVCVGWRDEARAQAELVYV